MFKYKKSISYGGRKKEQHKENCKKVQEKNRDNYIIKEKNKEKSKKYREENFDILKEKIKKYREENKDKVNEYYEKNKTKILEKNQREKITCECGSIICINTMVRHEKTIKHQEFLN